mmetsp:Transcript_21670/g.45520  ORF Transcript_21670/g.45520 Transcript_21670/m.45520 type:complete len:1137 (-) Transcript_21670:41-3451(-)|eukprot:CAMPEP_0171350300 /NCGR_PEP_ID=MMETSP0878-20121228/36142_1 /TAXON_ID=67004 /ORGANISM="Thalassiosira weissflogii, Strain CCMP1336" /LENGTH=1136 /DNA_ID=CAMNT_0011855205 /DNA_START=240 /DNA_END=3650 /DNA_ORIENTATION=+
MASSSLLATPLHPSNTTPVATASGLLALLSESDPSLVSHALSRLLSVVDTLWHEVAECLPDLEAIAEGGDVADDVMDDDGVAAANRPSIAYDLPTRQTAAAVASRVFFHLEEPVQALRLALESGEEHFDIRRGKGSMYVERLVNAAVETYVTRRAAEWEGRGAAVSRGGEEEDEAMALDMDKLARVVHLMFERCYEDGTYNHALGVAFEAREAGKVDEILNRLLADASAAGAGADYDAVLDTLSYALDAASALIPSKAFRTKSLELIASALDRVWNATAAVLAAAKRHAACKLVHCRQLLGDDRGVADVIVRLLDAPRLQGGEAGDDGALLGLQLCFDIVDSGDRAFVAKVAGHIPKCGDEEEGTRQSRSQPASSQEGTNGADGAGDNHDNHSDDVPRTPEQKIHFQNSHRVLTGGFTSELSLSFLYKHSNADRFIMTHLKKALEERGMGRNSLLHHCAVCAHGYLNAGTTNDSFLRDHLDWMKKASNWAKFSATASMGVIHASHTTEAMTLLEPYLPPSAPENDPNAEHPTVSSTGGYAEGGSLYALGIIHGSHSGSCATKRQEASAFLRNHLRNSHANEVISHGAALGVGLTSFGSADLEVVNELKELLYTDSAVAGEAASIAIGMVLVGSGAGNANSTTNVESKEELDEIIAELRNYSKETQHEKIIRGIAMCLALVNFGQEENADATIEEMKGDRDPIIRYGAMYGLALAYCGTGSNKAIRILLHTAVSDVNDDVRMAAVIGLALVLHKTPERVPELVRLLLESFNPHVRYASCMAVGIAMAGSGDAESVALLEPMLTDMTDYVRQGALLGTAMIYMQQSDTCNHRKVKSFREKLASIIGDKHQSTLTKMGAILSTGLIDVGGRNCALSLGSRNGFTKMSSAAGLVLWLQHWHWYPFMHMLGLAVTPTCTIGLNKDFKYPKKFEIRCNSKPSTFAYPKKLEEKKEEKKKRVETVTLSATAKNKARLARKRAKEEAEDGAMDVDKKEGEGDATEVSKEGEKDVSKAEGMEVDGEAGKDAETEAEKPKKKREPEPTSFRVSNPCRITKAQAEVCTFDLNQRYRPVRPEEKPYGVIMLTDSTPGEEEDLGAVRSPAAEDEADPPAPFEWAPPDHPENAVASGGDTAGEGEEKASD